MLGILLRSDIFLPIRYSLAISMSKRDWLARDNTLMPKDLIYGQEETNVVQVEKCRNAFQGTRERNTSDFKRSIDAPGSQLL